MKIAVQYIMLQIYLDRYEEILKQRNGEAFADFCKIKRNSKQYILLRLGHLSLGILL